MKILIRLFQFGVISGLAWALIPIFAMGFSNSIGEVFACLLASVLSGVLIQLILGFLSYGKSRPYPVLYSILALPFGAFIFGLIHSWLQPLFDSPSMQRRGDVWRSLPPLQAGWESFIAVTTPFVLPFFVPIAALTGILLYSVLQPESGGRQKRLKRE